MPQTWGDFELVDESKYQPRPDYTALARQQTQPAAPSPPAGSPVGATLRSMARSTQATPPAGQPDVEEERYRPGGFLGRTVASLFGPVLSDDQLAAIDGYDGYDPRTATGIAEAPAFERGDFSDMALRSFTRIPETAGNLVDLAPNIADAVIRALGGTPEDSLGLQFIREGLGYVSDAARQPAREAAEAGYGMGSVDSDQLLDALDPRTDAGGVLDRLGTVGRFIPETLVGSAGDMAMAVGAPYAYMGGRTNEIAENRAGNDQRDDVSLTDLGIAAPSAAIETMLERFTTGRVLPGGAALRPAAGGVGDVAARVAKETALQGTSGAVEEIVPYLAETLGTETGADGREALGTLLAGFLSEGALGGGVETARGLGDMAAPEQPVGEAIAQAVAGQAPQLQPTAPAPTSEVFAPSMSDFEVIEPGPASIPVAKPEPTPAAVEPTPPITQTEPAPVGPVPAAAAPAAAPVVAPAAPVASAPAPVAAPPAAAPARASKGPRKPADLLENIAASGGLNREAFLQQGVDPAELTRRAGFNYVFRKNGGMTPDGLREYMQQEGYLARDPEGSPPTVDDNAAYDLFDRAFRGGERIYTEGQAAEVAAYQASRQQADAEYRADLLAQPEFAAPAGAAEGYDPFADDPIAAEFSQRIADLTEEAYALGATDAEIVGASFDASVAGDHITALENLIEGRIRGRAEADPTADDRNPSRSPGARETPAPAAGGFQLDQPAGARGAEAAGSVAPAQSGLFAPPTSREQLDARGREVDANRDGLGRDAVPPSGGAGDLFAGPRPAQARIDDPAPANPPPKETAPKPGPRLTSVKNDVTDAEREAEGRDPIIRDARRSNRETVDAAIAAVRKTPSLGRETAARLAGGGTASLQDEAVLLVHKVDLRKRRDAAADRALDTSATEEARDEARREYDDLVLQVDEVDQAATRIGTETGRLLQLRRRMIADDYSLPALERKLRMVADRELRPDERAELEELAQTVAKLERQLEEADRRAASDQVAEMLAKLMARTPGPRATLTERRAAAAESRAALKALTTGSDPAAAAETRNGPGQAPAEDTRTRAILDSSIASGSAGSLVLKLAEQPGIRPEQRELAQRLAPILSRLKVGLVAAPENAPYAGVYENAMNHMWINQADPDTILHESVHGVTSALMTSREAKTDPEVRRMVREFEEMLDHLRMQVAMQEVAVPASVRRLLDDRQGPLSNIKELLSYGMTEKPFQEWLAELPPPPGREKARNLWQSFKDTIAKLFGKASGTSRSYLDALIESGAELIDYAGANPDRARAAQQEVAGRFRSDPAIAKERAPKVDPVAFFHLSRIGAFHYADGARDEAAWTTRMQADLGADLETYRAMLPDLFKASQAQARRPTDEAETVADALEAVGDQRRPRDIKRIVRAVVNGGARGEADVMNAAGDALGMDPDEVRRLFVKSEAKPQTLKEAQRELRDLRTLARLQGEIDRLEAGDPQTGRKPSKPDTAAIKTRREQLDALKAKMRIEALPDPEDRYQDMRERDLKRRIAELEARINAGDFAKRDRAERALSKENQRLRFELEKTKERFHKKAIDAEFEKRTPVGKLWGQTYAGVNFARAIMTSLDLSAVFRQGGFIVFGHPVRASKAVVPMLKSFASERADFEATQAINDRPNAPLYKKFGLELTGIGGDALSRTEEAYASRWVEKWSTWAGGGLVRGSGRAYTTFLNRIRADSFDAMLASLSRNAQKPTKAEAQAIANYINVATGRAGGIAKNPGEVLTATFFAPRLVASRFQLLVGQPAWGGSRRTRQLVGAEYVRFLIGVSVAVALAAAMRDDDDETKAFELDPRSANFGKVRFGKETFLDPLAGLAQVSVFLARMVTGEARQTKTDKLVPLRDKWRITDAAEMLGDGRELRKVKYGGADIPQEIMRFMRTKLAPVPGALFDTLAAEDMIGKETELTNEAAGLITPMSVGSLVDVLESQGMARGTAINLLGILGMSVQYRKSDEEREVEAENGVPGMIGVGAAE